MRDIVAVAKQLAAAVPSEKHELAEALERFIYDCSWKAPEQLEHPDKWYELGGILEDHATPIGADWTRELAVIFSGVRGNV